MSQLLEIKVPDIGDYQDVPVIEVHIKPGDRVEKEQSLITLESDKATMDVPSSHAGIVKEVKVKVGDSISEGGLVLLLEPSDASASAASSAPVPPTPAPQAAPAAPVQKTVAPPAAPMPTP
ncbi:MAG: dihydrolipoamide acetyltransferase, partial [Burkholderiaceae bacterium]|nr:dihydrolipoamide acetyltransferase [Burkholderiaceae bacterium]